MSTQINVSVALESLRKLSQAQINANRQAKLLGDNRTTTAQAALDGTTASRSLGTGSNAAAAGTGSNAAAAGAGSIYGARLRPNAKAEEIAANRRGEEDLPLAIGWLIRQSLDVLQITSGNGAASAPFVTDYQAILDAETAPSPFATSLTFVETYGGVPLWNVWTHRNTAAELLPNQPVWYRYRPCSQVELATVKAVTGYGRTGDFVLPVYDSLIYTRTTSAKWYRWDHLLTASTTVDYETASPFSDMIWTYEEVAGTAGEDPDTLLATPSRAKIMIININRPVTVADDQETQRSYDVTKSFAVGQTAVREITVPEAFQSKIDDIYGTLPSPSILTGIGAFSSGPVGSLPSLTSNVIDSATWSTVRVRPTGGFTGYSIRDPGLSVTRTPELLELIEDTPAGCFGLGNMEPDNAEMGYSSSTLRCIANPLIYRILDGTATYVEDDFYDTLQKLADCLTGLAPLPTKFQWVDTRPNRQFYPASVYTGSAQSVTFDTYASTVTNARPDADWYYMGGEGLPSAKGQPAQLKRNLVPLASRVEPGEDYIDVFSGGIRLLFTTPYGDTAYCRTKLLELGFTEPDLVP